MRRPSTLLFGLVILVTLLISVAVLSDDVIVLAQDRTPVPPPPTPSGDVNADVPALATAAAEDLAELREISELAADADAALGYAYDLFGLFEGITAIIGLAVPVIIGVGGFVGFRRLLQAEQSLETVRKRFESELATKQQELVDLQNRLEAVVKEQRDQSVRSTLAQALLPIGERQYRAQDFTGAIGTYKRALELDPGNPNTQYRLGYVYVQSGKLDEAQHHLRKALDIDDQFAPALATLGYVYRRIGEKMETGMERNHMLNEAERNLLKALDISPRLVDDDGESWWGSLGGLYRRRGQVDQAIHAYEQAAEFTPQSSYPFSNLALLYTQKGNIDRMMSTYKRVEQLALGEVQADVDNYWAYSDLLTSRLALGKKDLAEETLQNVLDTVPQDSPYVLSMLADTLERLVDALGGPDNPAAKHIPPYVDRIKDYQAQQQNNLSGVESNADAPPDQPGSTANNEKDANPVDDSPENK